jgi:Tol biopolymer transport system component
MTIRNLRPAIVAAALLGACNTTYDNPFANSNPTVALRADATILFTSNAYSTRPGFPREVFSANDSGSAVTRLTFCNNDTRQCDSVEAAPAPDRIRIALRRADTTASKAGPSTSTDAVGLLVVDLARSVEGSLLPGSAKVSGIDWSPTGDVLVYSAAGEAGFDDLFRADPNGQNTRDLTSCPTPSPSPPPSPPTCDPKTRERRPRIDPSGSAALFERIDATGKGQVWLFSSTGAQVRVTTGGDGSNVLPGTPYMVGADADPSYSPDGRSLVFRRLTGTGNNGRGTWDLMTARLDGTGLTTIVTGPAFRGAPDWGPKGIVFPEADAASSRLVLVKGDGSGRQALVTLGSSFEISYPRWLP